MKQTSKLIVFAILFCTFRLQIFGILPDRNYRLLPEKLGLIYKDLDVKKLPIIWKLKLDFFLLNHRFHKKKFDVAWENSIKKNIQNYW